MRVVITRGSNPSSYQEIAERGVIWGIAGKDGDHGFRARGLTQQKKGKQEEKK